MENHAIVRRMIVDSLRYWVQEMHVDGFRFDLASILTRDSSGQPMANPPVLWDIAFNSYWENLEFELPSMEQWLNVPWRRWIDTSLDSPADIVDWHIAASVPGLKYSVASRSIVVLFARLPD
jgi:pullulanase/glycogen debranching enzyme